MSHIPAQGNEGTIAATIRVMDDQEAAQLASEIVLIYTELISR